MEWTTQLILGLLAVLVILIGISVFKNWSLTNWVRSFNKQPNKHQLKATSPEEFDKLLIKINSLNLEERNLMLVFLVGQPVRVLLSIGLNGQSWISGIAPIGSTEPDFLETQPITDGPPPKHNKNYVG